MANKYVYQIFSETWDNFTLARQYNFIDAGTGCHGTPACSQAFVNAAIAAGMSPICCGGNDGVSTCGSSANAQCYQNLANMGFQAAGGESTAAEEQNAALQYIPFESFGGEGLAYWSNPFKSLGFGTGGKGAVFYCETFDSAQTLHLDDTVAALIDAHQRGVKEVGCMIGRWMPKEASPYIYIASKVESAGVPFSGFCLWNGCNVGGNTESTTINEWAGVIQTLQASYPPTDIQLKDRLAGKVTPVVTPADLSGIYAILFE